MDHFSKHMWAYGLREKDAKHVSMLFRHVLDDISHVHVVHSDNGGEFRGEFDELLEENGIKHVRSKPYTPQSHGLIERAVRTLRQYLQVQFTMSQSKKWDDGTLAKIVNAYNETPHSVTHVSPNSLLSGEHGHGQQARALELKQAKRMVVGSKVNDQNLVGKNVRVSLQFSDSNVRKQTSRKSAQPQWTTELFVVRSQSKKGYMVELGEKKILVPSATHLQVVSPDTVLIKEHVHTAPTFSNKALSRKPATPMLKERSKRAPQPRKLWPE